MTQINDRWHMLAEEENLFCDVLERICADKIAPLAAETDETSRFVDRQIATLGEAGMMGANLPEAYGGSAISAPALLRAVSIVAAACGSTASALTAHYLATDSILIGGTKAQNTPNRDCRYWVLISRTISRHAKSREASRSRPIARNNRQGWRSKLSGV